MKVVLSREAQSDLEVIADHIAADNPGRARSFVRELIAKARDWRGAARFPLAGNALEGGNSSPRAP